MFKSIARVNTDTIYSVEIGYDIPDVITPESKVDIKTQIVVMDENATIDTESIEYKQAESIAEVLKLGFDLGCSYTMRVIEQATNTGKKLFDDSIDGPITGTTSELVTE